MADQKEFNWDGLNGKTVARLRAPKIVPVPDAIVAQAQRSYDGIDNGNGELLHVLGHRFGSDAQAAEFARLMKHAGNHTTPISSVTAVVDPENTGDNRLVHWQAGKRRGRSATV